MGTKVVIDYDALSRSLGATADAIREKTGWESGYPFEAGTGFKKAIESIETGGGQSSQNNQWWLDWFKTKTNINGFFQGSTMTYIPEDIDWSNVVTASNALRQCLNIQQEYLFLNTINATHLGYLFYQSDNKIKELTIYATNVQDISGMVGQSCNIARVNFIGDCRNVKTSTNLGLNAKLERIYCFSDETLTNEIPLDFSNNTSKDTFNASNSFRRAWFANGCIKISMDFRSCPYLEDDTIQSIIDGYGDFTGSTAPTLSFHSVVGAKLTEEQKATLTAKNVVLAY